MPVYRLFSATMIVQGRHRSITWRKALAQPTFTRALMVGCVAGIAVALVLPHFFGWIKDKPGLILHDPLLAAWGPWNVSTLIFTLLYGTLLMVLVSIAKHPLKVIHGIYAYVLLLLLRMAAMALFTLEPPLAIIPLIDPVTQAFYPGSEPFLKDLFFSGHTATLALMALLAGKGPVRWIAVVATAAVAVLVLAQHVHWTVDVIAAVPAAWLAWKGAHLLLIVQGPIQGSQRGP